MRNSAGDADARIIYGDTVICKFSILPGATRRDERYVSKSDTRRVPHTNSDHSRRTFYGQPAPRRTYEYRRLSRHYGKNHREFLTEYDRNKKDLALTLPT